jgi:thymidine phosphorylase
VVARVEPRTVGEGVVAMHGGRTRVEDAIDPAAGYVITARPGDRVARGAPLATVHAGDTAALERGVEALRRAIRIADELDEEPLPLISHRVTAAGVEEWGAQPPRA